MKSTEWRNQAEDRARILRSLHCPGTPVIFANVFDAPTAEIVAQNPATKALATASFAIAAVRGLDDDDLDLETNIEALKHIIPVALEHGKPITVDIQDGYGDDLESVVTRIIELGASGCNIEDRDNSTGGLLSKEIATERIQRVCHAASVAGVPSFVVNARTDAILLNNDIDDAINRGRSYLHEGATTALVWGGLQRGLARGEVERISTAFDGRLNVIARLNTGGLSIRELAEIGVARISVGPALWRHAMSSFREKMQEYLIPER
ncbi:hypothetical protein N7520_004264 [Penicillium odoratum]|uniref:uncharacterized protein n=1 Tax=Penicillium odoratum TaxID=1167516 RepID=UPI0025475531|nr:uncharacterized protein N7520_004264 [Penicillium odoratum]KAJ5769705.1 hypothetical protein N7520_004264 [Penicillium odoratum]